MRTDGLLNCGGIVGRSVSRHAQSVHIHPFVVWGSAGIAAGKWSGSAFSGSAS